MVVPKFCAGRNFNATYSLIIGVSKLVYHSESSIVATVAEVNRMETALTIAKKYWSSSSARVGTPSGRCSLGVLAPELGSINRMEENGFSLE